MLPESAEADEAGLEADIRRAEESYREAAAIWANEGGAIREEYARMVNDGIIKGVHQSRFIKTRLESVQAYLTAGDP